MRCPPLFVKNILKHYVDEAFPPSKLGRPRNNSTMECIDYIYTLLRTGTQWCNLICNGSYKTINNTFHKWNRDGIFEKSYKHFLRIYVQKRRVSLNPINKHIIDTTFVKNIYGIDCVGRIPTDRGRRASKLSVITDDLGVTLAVAVYPANRNDCITLEDTIDKMIIPNIPTQNIIFLADKGYDSKKCRLCVANHKYIDGIYRKGKAIDNATTNDAKTGRYMVETSFAWLDLYRHIYVRYDRTILAYLGMTFFALLCIGSKKLERFT